MTSENKRAIVTGASSGIGLGLTKALVERGYKVVANSRRISSSGALKACDCLLLVDGDIARPETGARLVDAAVRSFGSAGTATAADMSSAGIIRNFGAVAGKD